jgi:nucleoside phosphorylase
MRVLIIDDKISKIAAITERIEKILVEPGLTRVDSAENLSDAVRLVSQNPYDLIILDLLLPYLPGGETDYRAGLELLKVIKRDNQINSGTAVIGLSEHPEEIESSRFKFEGEGVLLVHYSENGLWANSLQKIFKGLISKPSSKRIVDFIIIVALLEERVGLEKAGFRFGADSIINGLNVKHAELDCNRTTKSGVIILLPQMGLVTSTLISSITLNTFASDVICMSGICAGFSKRVELGQVIVASPTWEYQAGKWAKDGFLIAPSQIPLRSQTRIRIEKICQEVGIGNFLEDGLATEIGRPIKRIDPALMPFATGSAVIARNDRLKHIEAQHRQIGGIDMEAHGLYVAAHELAGPFMHFFAAKCVVDFADKDKGDDLHAYGSFVSARMLIKVLQRLFVGPET